MVSGVEVGVCSSVDVAEVKMASGVEVGTSSLFVLSEKGIGDIFAIAKL